MAAPNAELDDSAWLDEDNSDFNNLFADPAKFSSMLKAATVKPMYKRLRALFEDLTSYIVHHRKGPADQLHAVWPLVDQGVIDVIFDFVTNKELYKEERFNGHIRTLLLMSVQNITFFVDLIRNSEGVPFETISAVVTRWRWKANELYDLLWDHRHLVFHLTSVPDRDAATESQALEGENGIPLFIMHFSLVRHEGDVFLPHSAVQIILYLWAFYDHLKSSKACMTVMEMFTTRQAPAQAHQGLDSVFGAILSDVGDAETLISACLTVIRDERTIDRLLQRYLFLARSIVDYCPKQTFRKIQDTNPPDDLWAALSRAVLRACERQLCMGIQDDQIITDGVLRLGFSTICILFGIPHKHHSRAPAYGGSRGRSCLGKLDVVTLAAWLTIPAIERAESLPVADEIHEILFFHGGYMWNMHNSRICMSRGTARRITETGLRCIGPTLAALHGYKPRDKKSRKIRAELIVAWEDYRRWLRLSPSDEWTEQDEAESAVWGACALKTCLCSRRATHHHKMRVCKGCLRVLYCGPRCQALDWEEGGHRENCRHWRNLRE